MCTIFRSSNFPPIIIIAILLLSGKSYAQRPNSFLQSLYDHWRWAHFTVESGLPSKYIKAITETEDSTLWVGTDNGLARYDGFRWIQLHPDSQLIDNGLFNPDLEAVKNDVIAHFDNYQAYRWHAGFLKKIDYKFGDCTPLPGDSTIEMLIDSSMVILNLRTEKTTPLVLSSPVLVSPSKCLWRTRSGLLWFNLYDGLFCSDLHGQWKKKLTWSSEPIWINSVSSDMNGSGFISLAKPVELRGLWSFNPKGDLTRVLGEKGDRIVSMDCSPDGSVALALYSSGDVLVYDGNRWTTLNPLPVEMEHATIIRFKHNGDLLIGGENGVYLFDYHSTRWKYSTLPPPFKNRIHEIFRSRTGELWLGTADGVEIHSPDGKIRTVTTIDGLPLNDVTGVCEAENGSIWISSGSSFDGVYQYYHNRWSHISIDPGVRSMKIHKIRRDVDGALWFLRIAARDDDGSPGAYRYDGDRFVGYTVRGGLPSNTVYGFIRRADGTMVFATKNGLGMRTADGRWNQVKPRPELPTNPIFSVALDSTQTIWFSDRGYGLYTLPRNGNIHTYTKSNSNLSDLNIWDIVCDSSGTVWFSSQAGVVSFSNGLWKSYTEASGLRTPHIWPILPSGNIVNVGTVGCGLAELSPHENIDPPPLVLAEKPVTENGLTLLRWHPYAFGGIPSPEEILTRYRLKEGEWSAWSSNHSVTLKNLPVGAYTYEIEAKNLFGEYTTDENWSEGFVILPPVYLRPGVIIPIGILTIALIALSLISVAQRRRDTQKLRASEARFRRLTESTFEGIIIHRNGIVVDANENITTLFGIQIENLRGKPIKDIFTVDSIADLDRDLQSDFGGSREATARKADGSVISLEFFGKVLPTDNLSTPALTVLAVRDITKRKEAEQQLLQYQRQLRALALELTVTEEKERREIASYLHDYVSQELVFCRIKLDALREPISREDIDEITAHVKTLFEQMQSLTFELSPPILAELGLLDALESLCDRFLDKHGLEITLNHKTILPHIEPALQTFLFNAVREILLNIVKHAATNRSSLSLYADLTGIVIRIDDNGKGFVPEESPSNFNRGFGLFNIRERLRSFGGSLTIRSEQGKGSSIIMSIPLQQAAQPVTKELL